MKLSILGVMSNVQILLYTLFKSGCVATDKFGNRYYTAKPKGGETREHRWIIYKNKADASTIPAEYHGWLHYQSDKLPEDDNPNRHNWIKDREGNITGTNNAYKFKSEDKQDYTEWQP